MEENGIIATRGAVAVRNLPDRAGSRLGTRAGHGTRPSFSSEHPPRPASDVPTSCLPLKSWLRASYCRHSDRHWTHTVPPSVLQNRVMLLIWPQFLPCAYAPRTRDCTPSSAIPIPPCCTPCG